MGKDCVKCAEGLWLWRDCAKGHVDCFRATCECGYDSTDCMENMEGGL